MPQKVTMTDSRLTEISGGERGGGIGGWYQQRVTRRFLAVVNALICQG